jgi:hypothetical protein
MKLIGMTGAKVGRLTVLELMPERDKQGKAVWRCQCECGRQVSVTRACLRNGNTTSCGCRRAEICADRSTTHGLKDDERYSVWHNMITRCENPDNNRFQYYGAMGVKVCDRWRHGEDGKHGIVCFFEDMGERPPGLTIDRYPDTNGNYEPGNVRWATPRQQALGRRKKPNVGVQQRPSGKYAATIIQVYLGKLLYLGTFRTQADAIAVRRQAELARDKGIDVRRGVVGLVFIDRGVRLTRGKLFRLLYPYYDGDQVAA